MNSLELINENKGSYCYFGHVQKQELRYVWKKQIVTGAA